MRLSRSCRQFVEDRKDEDEDEELETVFVLLSRFSCRCSPADRKHTAWEELRTKTHQRYLQVNIRPTDELRTWSVGIWLNLGSEKNDFSMFSVSGRKFEPSSVSCLQADLSGGLECRQRSSGGKCFSSGWLYLKGSMWTEQDGDTKWSRSRQLYEQQLRVWAGSLQWLGFIHFSSKRYDNQTTWII